MKSITLLASLAAVSAISLAVACSSDSNSNNGSAGSPAAGGGKSDAGDTGENGGKTSAGGKTSTAGKSSTGDAGDTASGAGDTGTGATGGDTGEGGDTGTPSTGTAITSCTTGKLFEGDPTYDQDLTPATDGQALTADPPVRNQAVAVIGTHFFVNTDQEIWTTDMSVSKPKLNHLAGKEMDSGGFINAGVACADTTFLSVRDIAATADGKLVLVDYVAGAVIEITDPTGANCKSNYVAGTHAKTADPGSDYPLAQGDMDGPGADALFGGVGGGGGIQKVAVDPDGNIYTWDNGTGKFKMIATDTDRTVSTIGQGSADDNINGLTFLNGKLYAVGVDGTNDFLIEVDPSKYKKATPKGNVSDVYRARDHFSDVESGHQAQTMQVFNDGEALIISGQSGFVWRVATDGTVLKTLAGSGTFIDFTSDFDPTASHAATDWELVSNLSNSAGGPWITLADKKLYWSGGIGTAQYTVQFNCQ